MVSVADQILCKFVSFWPRKVYITVSQVNRKLQELHDIFRYAIQMKVLGVVHVDLTFIGDNNGILLEPREGGK